MHGRMLLPAWFAMLAPVAVVASRRGRLPASPALPLAPWALACAILLRVPYVGAGHDGLGPDGIADEHYYYTTRIGVFAAVTIGDYRGYGWRRTGCGSARSPRRGASWRSRAPRRRARRSSSISRRANPSDLASLHGHVGILGYAAGLRVHVIDRLGLADAVAAHVALAHRGRPGHEKWMEIPWAVARFAREPRAYNRINHMADPKVLDALAALGCGDLRRARRRRRRAAHAVPLRAQRLARVEADPAALPQRPHRRPRGALPDEIGPRAPRAQLARASGALRRCSSTRFG